jgi:hypothetical protein
VKRTEVNYIYTHEDSRMKPTKHCLKKVDKERGEEFRQGTEM